MFWRARKTRLALLAPLFAGLVLATACDDDPVEEDDPAEAIVSMRLVVGNQTINVNEGGTVTGGPIVINANTTITATFLDAAGATVGGLTEFELRVTSGNSARVTFTRINAFSGTLAKVAAGTTTLSVELFHTGEQHTDFGPFTIPITVN